MVLYKVHCYDTNNNYLGAHMAAGICTVSEPNGNPSYVTDGNGDRYYYCEATAEVGTSWLNSANVGFRPPGYNIAETYVI
ncbi:MAG: hypothetical protein LBH69_04945 [Methanomassiliicoccaceae archaeon]|nr:hypothetical protein [Methanomassiliicoccaceae archaeon]